MKPITTTTSPRPSYTMRAAMAGGKSYTREETAEDTLQARIWAARNRTNAGFCRPDLAVKFGGLVDHSIGTHNCPFLIPASKYFDDHPDWYSEIDGKRKHERAQLCLTNEEMTQELIKNVLETLRKNSDAKIIDVSQNDWHGFCTCEKCKAVDDAEESHAGTLLLMLNKVAEAVERESRVIGHYAGLLRPEKAV